MLKSIFLSLSVRLDSINEIVKCWSPFSSPWVQGWISISSSFTSLSFLTNSWIFKMFWNQIHSCHIYWGFFCSRYIWFLCTFKENNRSENISGYVPKLKFKYLEILICRFCKTYMRFREKMNFIGHTQATIRKIKLFI